MSRLLASAAIAVTLVVSASLPSAANHGNLDVYPYSWVYGPAYRDRVYYFTSNWPTSSPSRSQIRDQTADAMAEWNGVTDADLGFASDPGFDETYRVPSYWDCQGNPPPRDTLAWSDDIGTNLGATAACVGNSNTSKVIYINSDRNWYWLDDTPNDAHKRDFQATLVHELGHGSEGWDVCSNDPGDSDPCPGSHFDDVYNAAICAHADPQGFQTMCEEPLSVPGDPGNFGREWRQRSLEAHDISLFSAAY